LSRLRRPAKPLVALVAVIAAALVLSACAYFKSGSLVLTQPGGIGSARVHFVLCSGPDVEGEGCQPASNTEDLQYLLGIAVPPGSVVPQTLTAVPVAGGSPIVFTRNDEVAPQIAASSSSIEKLAKEEGAPPGVPGTQAWPPAGLEGIGYLSNPQHENEGELNEWNVDVDVALPTPAEGAPYPGPFATALAYGARQVNPEYPPSRPVRCAQIEKESMPDPSQAICPGVGLQGQFGTSDLKIGAPTKVSTFVGGTAKIKFPLEFASSTSPSPAFSLTASSTLSKASSKVSSKTYTPGAPDPSTHLAPSASSTVTVTVPKSAKPGTYKVTLAGTAAPGGGTVSQVAKLKVTKPTLKLGGVKLNKGNGTAILSVKVPGAGTLTVTGKGVVKATKKAKKAKKLKITVRTKGKTKAELEGSGKAKVKAKISFKPSSGIAVKKTKSITLKQG
jgi:hypothetical protein